MSRINLKEMKQQETFLSTQIDNNQKLADFCVKINNSFIALDKKSRDLKDNDYILIFYSHTFEFSFYHYDDKDNQITDFYIDCDGRLEINTHSQEVVEFAQVAHEIITKEFY